MPSTDMFTYDGTSLEMMAEAVKYWSAALNETSTNRKLDLLVDWKFDIAQCQVTCLHSSGAKKKLLAMGPVRSIMIHPATEVAFALPTQPSRVLTLGKRIQ